MRRSRGSSGDAVSLFPFLAVLICTMGSLIVLLVVLVMQAKASAVEHARQREQDLGKVREQAEQARLDIEESRWRIEMLQASREKTAEALEDKRRELSHLEDEIRRLKDQLDQAAAEAQDIESKAGEESLAEKASRERIDELKETLAKAERELEAARKARENEKPSYAILAYDGPNGTRRQPIYVECLEDRIVLQPEGVTFRSEDFTEPITDENPLATALRAKREYLKDATGDAEGLPYPLLVVRPRGAVSYAAARAAMKSWETEFGYELVEDELPLAYPEKDEKLTKLLEASVDEARARRRYLQSIAPARFGRRAPALLTASKTGGFVNAGGAEGDRGLPEPSPARASENRGRPAGLPGDGSGQGGPVDLAESSSRDGARVPEGAAAGPGPGSRMTDARDSGSGVGPGGYAAEAYAAAGGQGPARRGPAGTGQAGTGPVGEFSTAGGTGPGSGGPGTASSGPGNSTNRPANDGSNRTNGDANRGTGAAGGSGEPMGDPPATDGRYGDPLQLAGPQRSDPSGRSSGSATANERTTGPAGSRGGGSSDPAAVASTGRTPSGSSAQAAGERAAGSASVGNAAGSKVPGGSGGGAAVPSGGAGAGAGASGSTASSSLGGGMPAFGAGAGAGGGSRGQGKDWGLPSRAVNATGLTRPIIVQLSANQLVIHPEKKDRVRKPVVIPLQGAVEDDVDELVAKIWQRMESWGIAGQNMYWKPILQVRVDRGAEPVYDELVRLLQDSGISIVRK
jgi:hypothetical protein